MKPREVTMPVCPTEHEVAVAGLAMLKPSEVLPMIEARELGDVFTAPRDFFMRSLVALVAEHGAARVDFMLLAAEVEKRHPELAAELQDVFDRAPASVAMIGPHLDGLAEYKRRAALWQVGRTLQADAAAGDVDAVVRRAVDSLADTGPASGKAGWMDSGSDAAEIVAREYPDPLFLVNEVLPCGLTILAAKRKRGKSWLALGIGLAVAADDAVPVLGAFSCRRGRVLYLALEDTPSRMKRRIVQLGIAPTDRLHLFHDWPRVGAGCEERLRQWMTAHPDTSLVIVDVLQKVRPPAMRNGDAYAADYAALEPLHRLARDHAGLAVLVITHCRKAAGEDVFDEVTGTGGLTGCADTVCVLQRAAGNPDGSLWLTGRDIEERELAVRFDGDSGAWTSQGEAAEARLTATRREIADALRHHGRPATAAEVCRLLPEHPAGTVRRTLDRMTEAGQVKRSGLEYTV